MMKPKKANFNTNINVLGSVPDYATMIKYAGLNLQDSTDKDFNFRTENSLKRFVAAINQDLLSFNNDQHKKLLSYVYNTDDLRLDQKLLVLFWQLTINNRLFAQITENYFMKCVYAGRLSLLTNEILSFLYELRRTHADELQWSDATLKITASKYLTLMKKLGLAEGSQTKEIRYPNIGDEVFIILVKLALAAYPDTPSIHNPLFKFSFFDEISLINRLKAIKFTPLWNITQIETDIKIELTHE